MFVVVLTASLLAVLTSLRLYVMDTPESWFVVLAVVVRFLLDLDLVYYNTAMYAFFLLCLNDYFFIPLLFESEIN
jgi:hypothetical protein